MAAQPTSLQTRAHDQDWPRGRESREGQETDVLMMTETLGERVSPATQAGAGSQITAPPNAAASARRFNWKRLAIVACILGIVLAMVLLRS